MALLVARRTNNRKVVGSRPTKVVCITVLTGNRLRWTVHCGRPPLLLPICRKLEFRQSALMDSDLAWVNGKSGRQGWCYADAFQRSIISGAICHLAFDLYRTKWALAFVCLIFLYFFLATCARLSWPHSAFESTLNSCIVSYRIVLGLNVVYQASFKLISKTSSGTAVPANSHIPISL